MCLVFVQKRWNSPSTCGQERPSAESHLIDSKSLMRSSGLKRVLLWFDCIYLLLMLCIDCVDLRGVIRGDLPIPAECRRLASDTGRSEDGRKK